MRSGLVKSILPLRPHPTLSYEERVKPRSLISYLLYLSSIASTSGIAGIGWHIYIVVLMLENGDIHLSEAVTEVDGHKVGIAVAAGSLVI